MKKPFVFFHSDLRAVRQRLFPNIKDFHRAGGPAPDITTKIESGDSSVRPSTFTRYCEKLGLDPKEFLPPAMQTGRQRDALNIRVPARIIFKPVAPPVEPATSPLASDIRWRSSRTIVVIAPLDLVVKPGSPPVRIENIELRISTARDTLAYDDTVLRASFWSKHDKERNAEAHPTLVNQAIWLGLTPHDALGQGSSVQPFMLAAGQPLAHEVVFDNLDSRTWNAFVREALPDFQEHGIWLELAVAYADHNAVVRRALATFHCQPSDIARTLAYSGGSLEGERFKYGFVSFLQFEISSDSF